jgi:hypothetical protein
MGAKTEPDRTERPPKQDRAARLKAALKSNMAKRKAQARKRSEGAAGSGGKT